MQPRTVGELMLKLQQAMQNDELDWDSELLNDRFYHPMLTVRPNRVENGLRVTGHVVIL